MKRLIKLERDAWSAVIDLFHGANCISLRNKRYHATLLREPPECVKLDNPYFYGMPILFPVNRYDIEKNNLCDGSILKAFALLGYGKTAEAEACIATARKLDPNDFRIFAFDKIK